MENKEAHVGKMEARLAQWGAAFDTLVNKAGDAGTEVKIDYRWLMDDLKTKYQSAQAKLDELKTARSEDWDTIRIGFEKVWDDLETTFKKLKN